MKQKDFLTVMAVLDDDTQRKLASVQRKLFSAGLTGTQTMDIPFHVTLGSFPAEREKALSGQIAQAAVETGKFPIVLKRWNTFGFRVLFAEPDIPEELKALHVLFDCNYADGCPWSPHCTLFCGEETQVRQALALIDSEPFPIQAHVTAIELGRFFPARLICRHELHEKAHG